MKKASDGMTVPRTQRMDSDGAPVIEFTPAQCDDLETKLDVLVVIADLTRRVLAVGGAAPPYIAATMMEKQMIELLDILSPAIRKGIAVRQGQALSSEEGVRQ